MKVKIPHELKLKFLNLEGLHSTRETYEINHMGGRVMQVAGEAQHEVVLDLNGEPDLLKACIEWNRVIETYFKTSYTAARFDIGPYEGIWPCEIRADGTVVFRLDNVDLGKKDWKDWFVKEDMEYAPKQFT